MLLEMFAFLAFTSALGFLAWWTWRERQQARLVAEANAVRARSAEHKADANASQAELGRSLDAVAHDLNSLLMTMAINLDDEDRPSDEEAVGQRHASLIKAIASARALVTAVRKRARGEASNDGSIEGAVRLTTALIRSQGVKVRLAVDGDLQYHGSDFDALHLVHNLMSNAAHEAERVENGYVHVGLRHDALTITNPVLDPDEVFRRLSPTARSGKSPGGLELADQAASRLGWRLRYNLGSDSMTALVESARPVGTRVDRLSHGSL